MDIDSIAPGLDFVRVLEEQVDKCDVFPRKAVESSQNLRHRIEACEKGRIAPCL
jgi:hypothetical protein